MSGATFLSNHTKTYANHYVSFFLISVLLPGALILISDVKASSPVPGLNLAWPICNTYDTELKRCTVLKQIKTIQDFAEFNDIGNKRHHSGIDINLTGQVVAAADGLVEIHNMDFEKNNNECMGNVVVVKHTGFTDSTLYAHLANIEDGIDGKLVKKGELIGEVGGTAGNNCNCKYINEIRVCENSWPIHLHFEFRDNFDWDTYIDSGPFGYTPAGEGTATEGDQPYNFGYHDPVLNLHKWITPGYGELQVLPEGNGKNFRMGPTIEYREVGNTDINEGTSYRLVNRFDRSNTGCSMGWYQIEKVSGQYISDTYENLGSLPEVWVCQGNNGVPWIVGHPYSSCDADPTEPFSVEMNPPYSYDISSSGDHVDAKICSTSDVDYYRFVLAVDGAIDIKLEPPSGTDFRMELYNQYKFRLAKVDSSDGGGVARIIADAPAGEFFIKILGIEGSYNSSQDYRLTASFGAFCPQPLNALSEYIDTNEPLSCGVPLAAASVEATDGAYADRIRVNWSESYGALSYRIYRCTDSSQDSCGTYFDDAGAPFDDMGTIAGHIYYYRVSSCNTSGCSNLSDLDSGYRQSQTSEFPSVNLSASPATIAAGESTSITWSASDATTCTASGAWMGDKDPGGGSELSYPGGTTSYTLTCSGPGGSASESVLVTVTGTVDPPLVLMDATRYIVEPGGSSYLVWASGNATACTASGGWSGSKALSGYQQVFLPGTTTYTITCTGPSGSDSDSVTINVGTPDEVSLNAAPSTIFDGDDSTLSWTSSGMESCEASGAWSGSKPLNGSESVSPGSTRTYTLTCLESGGTVSDLIQNGEFSGTVTQWTKTGDFYADFSFDKCKSCPGYAYLVGSAGTLASSNNLSGEIYQAVSIPAEASSASLEFWFSTSTLETGDIDWDRLYITLRDSTGDHLSNVLTVSNVGASDAYQKITRDLMPYRGQTIQIHFRGETDESNGTIFRVDDVSVKVTTPNSYSDSATVTVLDPPEPTLEFNADPDTVNMGGNALLSWSATNVTGCNASGGWGGSKPLSGSDSVSPTVNTTYSLICTGSYGSITRQETVVVVQPAPNISLSALPSTIEYGESSNLTWSTTNATSCTALGAWSGDGSKPTSGAQAVSPEIASSYGLSCSGTGGSVEDSVTVSVNPPVGPEIKVLGNFVEIEDGDITPASEDYTFFGNVDIEGGSQKRTFYIANIGSQALNLTGIPEVSISGQHASDFTVTILPVSLVAPGGQTPFQVEFTPTSVGSRNAVVSIANSDSNENPYDFSIRGVGVSMQTSPLTERVSVDSNGNEGNASSSKPSASGDGWYLAFYSGAANLVDGDTNLVDDIFFRDRINNTTVRVSISSAGVEGNDDSRDPSIDSSGRYIAFESFADNLVPADTNGDADIFVHDLQTGITERVSVASDGTEGNMHSYDPSISADGRFVVFRSKSRNLTTPGGGGVHDNVIMHDRQTGETKLISISLSGTAGGNNYSREAAVSGDGRFVVFESEASNLVSGDVTGTIDILLRDVQNGTTQRINVSSEGAVGDGSSRSPSISSDGRYVAFYSSAGNLVPDDTNGDYDIFVHDRQTGTTERVSVASDGTEGNGNSYSPSISSDGRYVTFESYADNLVEGDSGERDIFVHDRQLGTTKKISMTSSGGLANGSSADPTISSDGRFVAFQSIADNLVDEDTNAVGDVFVRDREKNPIRSELIYKSGFEDN